MFLLDLRYVRHGEGEGVMIREFLGTDVEGIESVEAVGAVFEQVFLGFGKFLAGFVLAEAVASARHVGCPPVFLRLGNKLNSK